MENKFKIGIFGHGFLGEAMVHGFHLHADIKIYDKYKESDELEDVVAHSNMIFLCLPTPMIKETGRYDFSILEENLSAINNLCVSGSKIVVIRSTVTPGTTRKFADKFNNIKLVYNPEFLTARSNRLDFINASRIILGGDTDSVFAVERLYVHRFGNSINIYNTTWERAELTKMTANCFFAVKVLFFNTIYKTCEKLGIDYNDVKDMVLADGRIGRSHCDVPGHDGKFGVGGFCFPKDINAMIEFMDEIGVETDILKSTWNLNLIYRPEKDWENLGASVISKKINND